MLLNFLLFFIHFVVEVLIVIVSIEKFFEFFLIQQLHVLLDLITVIVFPVTVGVVGVEVVLNGRIEWRSHSMIEEVVPLEVPEPWVILYVFWTVEPQSV